MNHLTDEQWAQDFFAPLREFAEQPIPPSDCISPPRIWRVASGLADWDDNERAHFDDCPRCRKRFEQFRETIARSPVPGKPPGKPRAEAEPFRAEAGTVGVAALIADRVAEGTARVDPVLAIALNNGGSQQPAQTSAQLWHLDASRRSAATDSFPDSGADERTEVAVLRREDGTVQIKLDGFLLPQPGEWVRVEVRSGDGTDLFGSAGLPDGDDVIDLDDLSRPIQDGDRLQIIRRDESTGATLEIELEIRTT